MTRWPPPDPSKPNHYSWDSLGDPYRCKEDHNHPPRRGRSAAAWAANLIVFTLVGTGLAMIVCGVYGLLVLMFG